MGKLHSLYVFRGFRGCSEWCCKQCFKREIEIKWSSCLDFASPQDLKSVREKHPLQYSPCSSPLSIAQSIFTQEYTITQIFFIHMLYVSYWIFKYRFVFNGHMEAWLFSYFHKMLTSLIVFFYFLFLHWILKILDNTSISAWHAPPIILVYV